MSNRTSSTYYDWPRGYIYGHEVTWLSTSTVRVGDGDSRDDGDSINMTLSSPVTVDFSSSGAAGLDAGSVAANKWYYLHVISGSSGTSALASLSSTSPTLPSGYTIGSRLVGCCKTLSGSTNVTMFSLDGGGNERLYWFHDDTFNEVRLLNGGTATSWTALDPTTALIPDNVDMCNFYVYFRVTDTGTSPALLPHFRIRASGATTSAGMPFWSVGNWDVNGSQWTRLSPFWMGLGISDRQIEYEITSFVSGNLFYIFIPGFRFKV